MQHLYAGNQDLATLQEEKQTPGIRSKELERAEQLAIEWNNKNEYDEGQDDNMQ